MNGSKKVLRNSVILSVLAIVCTLVVATTIGLFTSTASAILNDSSLVAYWNLDEATGSVISDTAQNNTGATTGDPLHVAGKIGRALSFTSSTQYATIGNSGSGTTPLSVFTLSFWIKTTAANGTITSDPTSGFTVFLSGGKIIVKPTSVNTSTSSGTRLVNDNTWHLVTITRNGGGIGNLYVDTIRDNEANGNWGWPAQTSIKPAGLLFNRTPQNTSGNFIGKLDDVRIYNRAFNDVNDDASLAENAIGQLFVFQAPVALVPHLAFTIVPNDNIDVPTASYEFIHQAETTLACLLDGNSFTPCTSPASLSGLAPSIHTFVVTATDEFGVQNVIEDMFIFTLPPPPITSDPGSEDDQDGAAGIISDPSSNDDQDGAAGIISDPGSNDDQDGPAGIISNPSDDDQDAPGVNTSPILILVGTNTMTVLVDSIFTDPGAHAVDAQDGTLTPSIQTTGGPVVTSSPQTFTLTYTVTDSGGLTVSATRTVSVVAAPQPAPLVISDPSGDADQDAPAENELAPQQLAAASQSFSSSGSSSSGGGSVLGVTTTATSSGKISDGKVLGASASCGIYLPSPLYYGAKNDTKNVEKLQAFLNEVVGSNLTIDGIFGQTTVSAVKKFQLAHKDVIIDPWIEIGRNPRGIATGYVGPTTLWTINNMVCSELQLPQPVI